MQESNVILREEGTGNPGQSNPPREQIRKDLGVEWGLGPLASDNKRVLANKVYATFYKDTGEFAGEISYVGKDPNNPEVIYNGSSIKNLDKNIAIKVNEDNNKVSPLYKWAPSGKILSALKSVNNKVSLTSIRSNVTQVTSTYNATDVLTNVEVAAPEKISSENNNGKGILTPNFTQQQIILAQRAIENAIKSIKIAGNRITKMSILPVSDPSTITDRVVEANKGLKMFGLSQEELKRDKDSGKPEIFFKIDLLFEKALTPKEQADIQNTVKTSISEAQQAVAECFKYGDFFIRYFEKSEITSETTVADIIDKPESFAKRVLAKWKNSNIPTEGNIDDSDLEALTGFVKNYFKDEDPSKKITDVSPTDDPKKAVGELQTVIGNSFIEDKNKSKALVVRDPNVGAIQNKDQKSTELAVANDNKNLPAVADKQNTQVANVGEPSIANPKKEDIEDAEYRDVTEPEKVVNTQISALDLVKDTLDSKLLAGPTKIWYGDYNYNFYFEIVKEPSIVVGTSNKISTVLKVNKDAGRKAVARKAAGLLGNIAKAAVGGALSAANDFQQGKKSNIY